MVNRRGLERGGKGGGRGRVGRRGDLDIFSDLLKERGKGRIMWRRSRRHTTHWVIDLLSLAFLEMQRRGCTDSPQENARDLFYSFLFLPPRVRIRGRGRKGGWRKGNRGMSQALVMNNLLSIFHLYFHPQQLRGLIGWPRPGLSVAGNFFSLIVV